MALLTAVQDHFGFYIGQDGALAISPEFTAVFLRLTEHHIVTALVKDGKTVGLVSGHRDGRERHVYAMLHAGEQRIVRPVDALAELNSLERDFADCDVAFSDEGAVCTLAGQEFPLTLGDGIDMDELRRPQAFDASMSVAERMRAWNTNCWYVADEAGQFVRCNIGNGHFDCHWDIHVPNSVIYCRWGVSGYCEKGWAMLPTITLRANACGMLPDHRDALLPYRPNEDCFVADGCAFPQDGGWYWSVREVTQDRITLNGCGGDVYTIQRPR